MFLGQGREHPTYQIPNSVVLPVCLVTVYSQYCPDSLWVTTLVDSVLPPVTQPFQSLPNSLDLSERDTRLLIHLQEIHFFSLLSHGSSPFS